MIFYLSIAVLVAIAAFAINWGLSPYFKWKKLAEKPFTDKFTIVTKTGRIPLGDYMRAKQRENAKVQYTILVPSYNESKRLPNMIPKAIDHFNKMGYTYEIIVINDASKDQTTDVALKYSDHGGKKVDIKVLEYKINQGKGGAVRTGVIASSGEHILMVDADGASDITEFEKLVKKLNELQRNDWGIAAGSRGVEEEGSKAERAGIRLLLSKVSNFIIQTLCGVKIKDTQCGFKLFTRKTALTMFKALHIRRWAFDVELFVIANELNVPYAEVPHNYCDQDDSKLNVVTDSLQMARDFILIRLLYLLRLWRISHTDTIWEAFLPSETHASPKKLSVSPSRRTKRDD